jgi:geranylgeranyl pyrophosphate synthase
MEDFKQKALEELSTLPDNDAKTALKECVDFVTLRGF